MMQRSFQTGILYYMNSVVQKFWARSFAKALQWLWLQWGRSPAAVAEAATPSLHSNAW